MDKNRVLPGAAVHLVFTAFVMGTLLANPAALANGPDDGHEDQSNLLNGGEHEDTGGLQRRADPDAALMAHDEATANIVSSGPTAKVIKNLALKGRGERNVANATTDVWSHNGYAYTGTFNDPCGGDPEAGIWIWDVHNNNRPSFVGIIPSPVGSRSNDVRVASMNSGDVLVHSNEACDGGPGGFEIYNVDDPANPVALASVQTDDVNLLLQANFGFVDFGVHNLWLFTQGDRDYAAATVESLFGNFQIFDITDPANPVLVGFWGAEQSPNAVANGVPAGVDWVNTTDFTGVILPGNAYNNSGFGASQNRFLHDVTISADGTRAYLANWDEGLVLLDISDPSNPVHISTAIDVANGSLDGEVNSHSVWPSEDGTIVVEGEEDFSAWEGTVPPSNLTLDSSVPGDPTIPATAIATVAGDDFEANQTGNIGSTDGTSVEVSSGPLAGNIYGAVELSTAAGSPTFATTGPLSGELVWIGQACTGDPILNAGAVDPGDIAVVRRGACFFEEKANTAASLGAAAVVIANNQLSTPWSGLRIWDYSDPSNPVLASLFDTVCSASTEPGGDCDPAGTYSSHNVVVESRGNKVLAYVSWYSDGMLVLDVSDPYDPVEVARFLDDSMNGGEPNDFWGVYKVPNSPWIYGSDRNGGLYVFKELGSGSAKKGPATAEASAAAAGNSGSGFVRGIVLNVDGVDYYLAGAPDGPGGAVDIPGHAWVEAGPVQIQGKHYNTGPFGAPQWWSSDAPDGELLYVVHGVIDTWTPENASSYAARGYVHYHELVSVADGSLHPTKVVWLRHHARTSFTLDGGPRPDLAHVVTPGVDFEFINNYFVPYAP